MEYNNCYEEFAVWKEQKRCDIEKYTSMTDIEMAYPNYHVNSRQLMDMLSDMRMYHLQEIGALKDDLSNYMAMLLDIKDNVLPFLNGNVTSLQRQNKKRQEAIQSIRALLEER